MKRAKEILDRFWFEMAQADLDLGPPLIIDLRKARSSGVGQHDPHYTPVVRIRMAGDHSAPHQPVDQARCAWQRHLHLVGDIDHPLAVLFADSPQTPQLEGRKLEDP